MKSRQGFTLIELLVVISIIALLIGLLLPALGAARRVARQMQSNTQMRGMHQAMVIFAQENKNLYPGLESSGDRWMLPAENLSNMSGASVQGRFALLIEGGFVTPEYLIHPAEPDFRVTHEPYKLGSGDTFDIEHYSYAMLSIAVNAPPANGAVNKNESQYVRQEWQSNTNPQAIILSDRLVDVEGNAFNDPNAYLGVWSRRTGDAQWGVVWNDNHTSFEATPVFPTRYGGVSNTNDDIYSRGRTGAGNVQTPAITQPNNDANAIMVSNREIGLQQKPAP